MHHQTTIALDEGGDNNCRLHLVVSNVATDLFPLLLMDHRPNPKAIALLAVVSVGTSTVASERGVYASRFRLFLPKGHGNMNQLLL